jgi:peptidoglycan hydrolase-like protein with peptidoglycan-binding domain
MSLPLSVRSVAAAAVLALAVAVISTTVAGPADSRTANIVTPGSFRGYGFDQCMAPSQSDMNAWLRQSPYLAVGIYISGASRGCRQQPNLTPTWVSTQLADGWKLLPITLGPQAPCNPRFPRYGNDPVINGDPGRHGRYGKARAQGAAEAQKTVTAAQALGIAPGSTMWYDLEAFDLSKPGCRNASLAFLSAWTREIHALHYLSGVYSSAGSGILMLDRVRLNHPGQYLLPDQVWIARWDGEANTDTTYISGDGWRPGGRMKQYVGGHDETWGGVRINIDTDYLDLGQVTAPTETHCGGVLVDFRDYGQVNAASDATTVKALQCLLREQQAYAGKLTGHVDAATLAAVNAWQLAHDFAQHRYWNRRNWMSLLVAGDQPVIKYGSAGPAVRDLQRALDAATPGTNLRVSGVFNLPTDVALRTWQTAVGRASRGVANPSTWRALASGLRVR